MLIRLSVSTIFLCVVNFSLQANWGTSALLGVSAGYSRSLGQYNIDFSYSGSLLSFNDVQDDSGYLIGILAGLQGVQKEWLVGVELRINDFEMDHSRYANFTVSPGLPTTRVWSTYAKVKQGTDFGGLIRVGYIMTPYFLPYIHLGAETSRNSLDVAVAGAPEIFPYGIALQDRRWVYSITGGVGMEFSIPKVETLSFRVEYMFRVPGTILQADGIIQDGSLNPLFSVNVEPRTQSIAGALVWNIA